VGPTSDVLTAYRVINQAGGLVIGAHANSGNGVAMRGIDFGGQTRIAYTQDPNLHVLEVTDLEKRGRYTTRRFFNGSKPEYPRPMRCIQGSDAHLLMKDPAHPKHLGIGDRTTEILLDELSFEALANVLKGNDFSLTRPYHGPANPVDFVQMAQEEGESIVQAFHESMALRGGFLDKILFDICAMANTNGGAIYVGVSANPKEFPVGVRDPKNSIDRLQTAVADRFSPSPEIRVDGLRTKGKQVVRIVVEPGADLPYAIDDNNFYVRDESETSLAVRDEIVRLVLKRQGRDGDFEFPPDASTEQAPIAKQEKDQRGTKKVAPPRTGVEIVKSEQRQGTYFHTVQDLRNGNLIKNVTKKSARKLWHYAISKVEAGAYPADKIKWQGNIAMLNQRKKDENVWYDLALREGNNVHIYYGVTDSGLNEDWLPLIGQ